MNETPTPTQSIGSIVISGGNGQSAVINQPFAQLIVAQVLDSAGQPYTGGYAVTFSVPGSGASATFAGGGLSYSTFSDSSGHAYATALTANGAVGLWNGLAAGTIPYQASFQLQNNAIPLVPTTITIQGGNNQSAIIGTPFGAPLSVLVKDQNGAVMAGQVVTFTPPGTGAACAIAGASPTTNASGIATTGTVTANATPGTYNVTITCGGASAVLSLTNFRMFGLLMEC